MLKNYLKIAFRSLLKNKYFSLINILGLAIGMAASFWILQYVSYELSYDDFHQEAQNIYRITLDIEKKGSSQTQSARVSPAVAARFQEAHPEIENYSRMVILGPDAVLSYEDKFKGEKEVYLADSAFFDIFSYPLIYGDPVTALNEPFTVIITSSTSQALFQSDNPVGKDIIINADNFDGTSMSFKVTGVIEDFPENTHLQPAVLISYATLFEFVGHQFDDSWTWNMTYSYVKMHSETDPQRLEEGFKEVVSFHNQSFLDEQQMKWTYHLQPITDIHLHSDLQHEPSVNAKAFYVYLLAIIGFVILMIAYINFVNLLTVQSLKRAKEVGIRKVSGAFHRQLVFQFFLEALLINLVAFVLCITLLQLGTPIFTRLFEVKLDFYQMINGKLWIGFVLFLLLLVFGSGFYPAFMLSRQQAAKILKGKIAAGGVSLRKSLVVSQFSLALLLITMTLATTMQIRFMQKQNLGFDTEKILIMMGPNDYGFENNFFAFQNKLNSMAAFSSVSGSIVVPGQEIFNYNDHIKINGKQTSGIFSIHYVDKNYFQHYQIPLLSGKNFSTEAKPDWIINETAMRLLGFNDPQEALGHSIDRNGQIGEIIGVVKDYHHRSLKVAISPIFFYCTRDHNYYSIKMESNDLQASIEDLKSTFEELFPGSPFEYFFLDEFFDRQYKADQRFNSFFSIFSGLTIFIACMGLLALSAFTARQRTKEIGIRKVLGASVQNIIFLLTKEHIKLVLMAGIVALPLSYWVIDSWLQDYAYHIELRWWFLLVPMLVLLLITVLTISFQSVRAALANPSQSLRYE